MSVISTYHLLSYTDDQLRHLIATQPHRIRINQRVPYYSEQYHDNDNDNECYIDDDMTEEIMQQIKQERQMKIEQRESYQGQSLLMHAIENGQPQRMSILQSHPTQKLNVNPRSSELQDGCSSPLIDVCLRDSSTMDEKQQQQQDSIAMQFISQLALAGADPNHVNLNDGCSALDQLLARGSVHVAEHLLDVFHPMNQGITSHIPIDLTKGDDDGALVFHYPHYMRLGQKGDAQTHTGMTLTDLIRRVNEKHHSLLHIPMHTFSMATHPRVGRASAVHGVFRCSPMYDSHLVRLISKFVCSRFIPLPCTLEEAQKMRAAKMEQSMAYRSDWMQRHATFIARAKEKQMKRLEEGNIYEDEDQDGMDQNDLDGEMDEDEDEDEGEDEDEENDDDEDDDLRNDDLY